MSDDLDGLLGDEPPEEPGYEPQSTEYSVGGRRSNSRLIAIVAVVVVLIVAAGVGIGIAVGHHGSKKNSADNNVNQVPAPTVTVTITQTATASPSPSATASASSSPASSPTSNPVTGTSTGQAHRVKTFYAYYAAINAKDWQTVYDLGGKNLDTSYDAMVAGYSNTAKDVPYLVGFNGHQLVMKLLAFQNNGRAQLYSGTLTINHGEITSAQQSLSYADRNDSFGSLAGEWSGHDRDLEITPGGLGILSYRSFNGCPVLADGCDQFVGNYIVNGATTIFQLDGGQANVATGHVTFSSVGAGSSMSLSQDSSNDTITLSLLKDAPLCGSTAPQGTCGA